MRRILVTAGHCICLLAIKQPYSFLHHIICILPRRTKKGEECLLSWRKSTLLTSFNHTDGHDLYLSVQSETLAEQQPTDATRVVTYEIIDSRDQIINQFTCDILFVGI